MSRVRCHVARVGTTNHWGLWAWGPGICEGVLRADGTVAPPRRRDRSNGTNPVLLHSVRGDDTAPLWMQDLAEEIDDRCTLRTARRRVQQVLAYGPHRLSQQARRARDAAQE